MEMFRPCYLKENTIPIISPLGLEHGTNQSKVVAVATIYVVQTQH